MDVRQFPHYFLETSSRKVLLINPPVYDIRLPWSQWQQPTTLLQISTLLRNYDCDIRLIDSLFVIPSQRLSKSKVDVLTRGETKINYWRFGLQKELIRAKLNEFKEKRWVPEEIYIEGFTTYWWPGVKEVSELAKQVFPQARVILVGAYPALLSDHALYSSGADVVVTGSFIGLIGTPADYSLYPITPSFAYINIGHPNKTLEDVVKNFLALATNKDISSRIATFVFADHMVASRFPEHFRAILGTVIDRKLRINFYALGNLHPVELIEHPDLAVLMKLAGFKEITFADDRDIPLTSMARSLFTQWCEQAAQICTSAGFSFRTKAINGSVSIGQMGESLEETSMHMTKLAHVCGSLIVIPYQPQPDECVGGLTIEYQNGKLFPFAELNGYSYKEYQNVLGLAAVLNAKYRDRTFDFMGKSLVSQLVRSSLITESWDPRNTVDLVPPKPITVGHFNKEGKWVRS
jgi:hypothetical protein